MGTPKKKAMPTLGLGILATPLLLAHGAPSLLVQKDAQYVVGRDAVSESPSILTNGDFETGSIAPWSFTQPVKPFGVVLSLAPNDNLEPARMVSQGAAGTGVF